MKSGTKAMKVRQIVGGIAVTLISIACSAEDFYFSCRGRTGIADGQSALPLLSKAITSNENSVDGSMHVTTDSVIVDGIPFVASTYRICENDDQSIWFSPSGSKDYCAGNDLLMDLGVFNKVTGKLTYHVGDFLAILQCRKASKLIK